MIYFVVPRDQEFGIRDYLETWGRNLVGLLSVLHYEDLPGLKAVPAGTYLQVRAARVLRTGRLLWPLVLPALAWPDCRGRHAFSGTGAPGQAGNSGFAGPS